ncbi:MAG: hypothetical protein JNL05_00535, partial [Flavobacteriales bacterium]|nr:hypothetical protein [Flavobacteriales bacterium]
AFTGIHAKCFVLIGENESYTVVTTANLTRNKRIELYVVDTHAHVANGYASWITDTINAHQHGRQ